MCSSRKAPPRRPDDSDRAAAGGRHVGVEANLASVVELTSGPEAIGFTVYLTSAEATATTIDYQVTAPGAGFLTAADFGGTLPGGTVTIAAGQTSAVFTVALRRTCWAASRTTTSR